MAEESKSFWTTLPGILTGLAALITAIGGLMLIFNKSPNSNHSSENSVSKIIGEWTFILHSDVTGITLKGTLTLNPDQGSGENNVIGRIETFNTDWNNFSGDIKGIFINNELKLSRETGVENVIQYYDLFYYSASNLSGTFHNAGNNIEKYKDNGTFVISH